jgi:hypothetical protein
MATQEPKSGRCGAQTRSGGYCEKYPAQGRSRCRFHGGATPTKDENPNVGAPENNDFAEGNSGGKPPEGNTNGAIHYGFASWEKEYERLEGRSREFVERMIADMRETAKEHAPEVDVDRREELLKEKATLSILFRRASCDTTPNAEDSRGFIIEDTTEIDGETYTRKKPNPAIEATLQHSARQREIAKELSLWVGYQD